MISSQDWDDLGPEDSLRTVGARPRAGRRGAPANKSAAAQKSAAARAPPRPSSGRFLSHGRFSLPRSALAALRPTAPGAVLLAGLSPTGMKIILALR